MNRKYDLEERLLDYTAAIVRFIEEIRRTPAGIHVAGQLLRAGTSPLPNHGEAEAAESNADFIHKMSICLKELRETRRWLRLVQRVPLVGSGRDRGSVAPGKRRTRPYIFHRDKNRQEAWLTAKAAI